MIVIAALLLAPTTGPLVVMRAYWDKLGRAQRIFAKISVPSPQEGRLVTYDCWLEKPNRMKMVAGQIEIRWDGKTTRVYNRATGVRHKEAASKNDVPPMFAPFFADHRWALPQAAVWGEGKPCIELLPTRDAPADTRVDIDPRTKLPLGSRGLYGSNVFVGECRLIRIDPPKLGFRID